MYGVPKITNREQFLTIDICTNEANRKLFPLVKIYNGTYSSELEAILPNLCIRASRIQFMKKVISTNNINDIVDKILEIERYILNNQHYEMMIESIQTTATIPFLVELGRQFKLSLKLIIKDKMCHYEFYSKEATTFLELTAIFYNEDWIVNVLQY